MLIMKWYEDPRKAFIIIVTGQVVAFVFLCIIWIKLSSNHECPDPKQVVTEKIQYVQESDAEKYETIELKDYSYDLTNVKDVGNTNGKFTFSNNHSSNAYAIECWFRGHKYLMIWHNGNCGITHHPECACLHK